MAPLITSRVTLGKPLTSVPMCPHVQNENKSSYFVGFSLLGTLLAIVLFATLGLGPAATVSPLRDKRSYKPLRSRASRHRPSTAPNQPFFQGLCKGPHIHSHLSPYLLSHLKTALLKAQGGRGLRWKKLRHRGAEGAACGCARACGEASCSVADCPEGPLSGLASVET